jgi:hypothetical protein
VVLMGPEQPLSAFDEQVGGGQHWDGVGMGYGVRGSRLENLTIRAEGKGSTRKPMLREWYG